MFQSACVSEVCEFSSANEPAVQAGAVQNDQLTQEEFGVVVHKLELGRMAGPDGLRAGLLREMYTLEHMELDDGRRVWWHTYDHSPCPSCMICGSCSALPSPQVSSQPHGVLVLCQQFLKGETLLSWVLRVQVVEKLFSLVMHHSLDSWAAVKAGCGPQVEYHHAQVVVWDAAAVGLHPFCAV